MPRVALLLLSLLAACAQPPAPPAGPRPLPAGGCNAGAASFSVGQLATAALLADARRRAGAERARVIRSGEAVTLEFQASRLNLELDAAGRVTRVRCG